MKRELSAGIGAYIGYTPKPVELRRALAYPGQDELPRSTHDGWRTDSGLDRTSDSLLRVANYYNGRKDADGNTINGGRMYVHLLKFFGHSVPGELDRPQSGGTFGDRLTPRSQTAVQDEQDTPQIGQVSNS